MTKMRHDCEERGCFLVQRWDCGSVGDAFRSANGCWPIPRGCSPTDIDGELEISECLLHIESKRTKEKLETGQELSLTRKADCYGHSIIIQRTPEPALNVISHVELMFRSLGDVGVRECIDAANLGEPCWVGEFEQREFSADAVLRDELVLAWALWVDGKRCGNHPWMLGADVGQWLDEHYPSYRRQQVLA